MAITEDQVNAAQQAWCDGLVEIGKIHQAGGDVRAAAMALVNGLYDYAEGVVFFKPTMAHGKQTFRDTAKGACRISWEEIRTFPMTRDLP